MRGAALPVHRARRPYSGPGRARAEHRAESARSTPSGICTGPLQRVSAIRGRVGIRARSHADSRPNARTVGNPRPSLLAGHPRADARSDGPLPAGRSGRRVPRHSGRAGDKVRESRNNALLACASGPGKHGRARHRSVHAVLASPPGPLRRAKKPSFRAQIVPCPVPSAAVCWVG